ncbi:MAG: hypothetical protein OXQ29_06555 [Rhodospirillaceae bacterium]|nr:hypothetical protein [Rhodospirillaceae bacterium]
MAIVAADLEKRYSRRTTIELRRKTIMLRLCSSAFTEGWVGGANTVYIPRPNWSQNDTPTPDEGVVASARARGGDWAAMRAVDQDLLTFTRSGGFASSMMIPWEDVVELPWPVVERTRSRMRYELRTQIESGIYGRITAAIAAEPSTPNFQALGDDTDFIARATGKPSTDAARGLVYDAIDDFSLKLEEADVGGDGDSVGQKWGIMPPAIFRILREDIKAGKYSWDELTRDLLRNNSVLAGMGYRGRLLDIDIFSWNGVPKAASTAGPNTAAEREHNWQMLFAVNGANAAAIRPNLTQYFTPRENQITDEPGHAIRMVGDYGHLLLEPNLTTLYAIDGGEDS